MHKQQPSPISPRGSTHANPKMARYLHRIQQLVGNRNVSRSRSISPIASRIHKPIRANALDSYLKYELTLKIICAVFDKKNQHFKRSAINQIKQIIRVNNKDGKSAAKVQKIYKFVPIEKTECAHMIVDTKISAKMLLSILKTKFKDTLKQAFHKIQASELSSSNIVINTARSGKSMILPVTLSKKWSNENQPKKYLITTVLTKIYFLNKLKCFNKIVVHSNRGQKEIGYDKVYQQLKFNKLSKIMEKIKFKHLSSSFSKLFKNQVKFTVQQYETQLAKQKLRQLAKLKRIIYKNKLLRSVSELLLSTIRKNIEKAEESVYKSMISTSEHQNATQLQILYQATNKINISLISIIIRRKVEFIKLLAAMYNRGNKGCEKTIQIINKIQIMSLSSSFSQIKLFSQRKKIQAQGRHQWKGVSTLSKIQAYFYYTLRQPLHKIYAFSEAKLSIQANSQHLASTVQKIKMRKAFDKVAQSDNKNSVLQQKSIINKQNYALPRVCHKIIICQLASFFVKLKIYSDRKKANTKKPKSEISIDWSADIKQFIAERERFNDGLKENYRKFEEMLKIEGKTEDDSFSKYQSRKPVFSPKNKSPYTNLFSK